MSVFDDHVTMRSFFRKERNKTSEGLYSDCMPLIDNFELVPERFDIKKLFLIRFLNFSANR